MTIACFAAFCIGCNMGDHEVDLGNDYIFLYEGESSNKIVKRLGSNDHSMRYNIVVPMAVIDYAHNQTHIIAVQAEIQPFYSNSSDVLEDLNRVENHSYWIIEPKIDSLYGPLTKSAFALLRKDLNISKQLALGTVEGE